MNFKNVLKLKSLGLLLGCCDIPKQRLEGRRLTEILTVQHTQAAQGLGVVRDIAERRKGLRRKIIIKVTLSRDINIKNQVKRFISARIVLGVGVQRHISN